MSQSEQFVIIWDEVIGYDDFAALVALEAVASNARMVAQKANSAYQSRIIAMAKSAAMARLSTDFNTGELSVEAELYGAGFSNPQPKLKIKAKSNEQIEAFWSGSAVRLSPC